MRFLALLALATVVLAGCSSAPVKASKYVYPDFKTISPDLALQKMCIEENIGLLRFSRTTLEEFCPKLKSPIELTCLRFLHSTKDWYKACEGIDTLEKLECVATVGNGPGYATVEALAKCRNASNRAQIYCLSEHVAQDAIALLPETVQQCLDKNPGEKAPDSKGCGWGVADPVACPTEK
jgi:hypothetical protein